MNESPLFWSGAKIIRPAQISGRYCTLHPFDIKIHGKLLYDAFDSSGNELWTFLPYGPFREYTEFAKWATETICDTDTKLYVISDAATALPSGCIAYWAINEAHGRLEIGHVIFSRAIQRSRIGTESIYLMLENAYAHRYRRYEWRCDSNNINSKATARRIGFTFEGTFRNHMVVKGKNRDTCCFAMTDRDWSERRGSIKEWLSTINFDSRDRERNKLKRRVSNV